MASPPTPDPFLIRPEAGAPVLVLTLEADALDSREGADRWFRSAAAEVARTGVCRVLVDGGAVAFTGAAGVGRLVRLYREVRRGGGRLALCRLAPTVADVLRLTRLDHLMPIFETPTAALAALRD